MYVDDVLSGADSAEDAKFIVRDLRVRGVSIEKMDLQSDNLLTTDFLEIDTESTAKTLGVR